MAYINGNKILNVEMTGLVNIDQTYDPNSENPQSGKAVAEAIENMSNTILANFVNVAEVGQ